MITFLHLLTSRLLRCCDFYITQEKRTANTDGCRDIFSLSFCLSLSLYIYISIYLSISWFFLFFWEVLLQSLQSAVTYGDWNLALQQKIKICTT